MNNIPNGNMAGSMNELAPLLFPVYQHSACHVDDALLRIVLAHELSHSLQNLPGMCAQREAAPPEQSMTKP
jgi:hypothetical protein